MSKYKFSAAERFAVYITHKERCYLCHKPLDFLTLEVDHIVPESLLGNPIRLKQVLKALGRPEDFFVNNFENWLPACRPCNGKKLEHVFEPSPMIQLLLQSAAKASKGARELSQEVVSTRNISNALGVLQRANENGILSQATRLALEPLVAFQRTHRAPDMVEAPVKLTPLYEVLSENNDSQIVRGPYGVGQKSIAAHRDSSWNCVNCGSIAAWNGARCVICGQMDDD